MDPLETNPPDGDAQPSFSFGTCTQLLTVTAPSGLSKLCGCQHGDVLTVDVALWVSPGVCFIEQHHWPVGKVSKVHSLRLPDLLYGVTSVPDCCTHDELRLEQMQEIPCFRTPHPTCDVWAAANSKIVDIITGHSRKLFSSGIVKSASDEEVESVPSRWAMPASGEETQHPSTRGNRDGGRGPAPGPPAYVHMIVGSSTASPAAIASIRMVTDIVYVRDAATQARVGSPVPMPRCWFPAGIEGPSPTLDDASLVFVLHEVTEKG